MSSRSAGRRSSHESVVWVRGVGDDGGQRRSGAAGAARAGDRRRLDDGIRARDAGVGALPRTRRRPRRLGPHRPRGGHTGAARRRDRHDAVRHPSRRHALRAHRSRIAGPARRACLDPRARAAACLRAGAVVRRLRRRGADALPDHRPGRARRPRRLRDRRRPAGRRPRVGRVAPAAVAAHDRYRAATLRRERANRPAAPGARR